MGIKAKDLKPLIYQKFRTAFCKQFPNINVTKKEVIPRPISGLPLCVIIEGNGWIHSMLNISGMTLGSMEQSIMKEFLHIVRMGRQIKKIIIEFDSQVPINKLKEQEKRRKNKMRISDSDILSMYNNGMFDLPFMMNQKNNYQAIALDIWKDDSRAFSAILSYISHFLRNFSFHDIAKVEQLYYNIEDLNQLQYHRLSDTILEIHSAVSTFSLCQKKTPFGEPIKYKKNNVPDSESSIYSYCETANWSRRFLDNSCITCTESASGEAELKLVKTIVSEIETETSDCSVFDIEEKKMPLQFYLLCADTDIIPILLLNEFRIRGARVFVDLFFKCGKHSTATESDKIGKSKTKRKIETEQDKEIENIESSNVYEATELHKAITQHFFEHFPHIVHPVELFCLLLILTGTDYNENIPGLSCANIYHFLFEGQLKTLLNVDYSNAKFLSIFCKEPMLYRDHFVTVEITEYIIAQFIYHFHLNYPPSHHTRTIKIKEEESKVLDVVQLRRRIVHGSKLNNLPESDEVLLGTIRRAIWTFLYWINASITIDYLPQPFDKCACAPPRQKSKFGFEISKDGFHVEYSKTVCMGDNS